MQVVDTILGTVPGIRCIYKAALALCGLQEIRRRQLSITPDRRKTLVFSRKSQETCLSGGPPVHGRRPQCRSPQCKSPLVVQWVISMSVMMILQAFCYRGFGDFLLFPASRKYFRSCVLQSVRGTGEIVSGQVCLYHCAQHMKESGYRTVS